MIIDNIKNRIFNVRGLQVIIDRDLAKIYGVETRVLKQAVKRNINRFPDDFMFVLTDGEIECLVSQSVIPSKQHLGGAKPFVFTKLGVRIVAEILKKDIQIDLIFNKENKNALIVKNEDLRSKIYDIRGLKVMLDFDLAKLYDVKAIRLREQVKRNPKRFPKDFMFQLTEDEINIMVSQNAIPSKSVLGGFNSYVFTEQGIASLSSVLTNDKAIEVNIEIMRVFVEMRQFISQNGNLFQRINNIEQKQIVSDIKQLDTNSKIDAIWDAIEERGIKPKQGIFYDGQVFDAYAFVSDLIKQAKQSIILIDNYIDESVLTMFLKRNKNCKLTIYTQKISKQLQLDLDKHNRQYDNVTVKIFKYAHDRFLILDNKKIYHFGASLKDLGNKIFAFSKMELSAIEMIDNLKREVRDD